MKNKLVHNIIHHAIGKFLSFIAALWASGLVSAFFEKKSSQNLWGISSEKSVLSGDAYHAIQSTLTVIIGFIVLLFVDYLIETKKHIALWEKTKQMSPVVVAETKRYFLLSISESKKYVTAMNYYMKKLYENRINKNPKSNF